MEASLDEAHFLLQMRRMLALDEARARAMGREARRRHGADQAFFRESLQRFARGVGASAS